MRLAVLDVGSTAAQLVVCEIRGGAPVQVKQVKWKLRLGESADTQGRLSESAVDRLAETASQARAITERWQASRLFAYASATVRDAPNREAIVTRVARRSGVRMVTLPGELETEIAFLAARRWLGWQAGSLALLDLGGGTFDIAYGTGSVPDYCVSLPLGAARLTRRWFPAGGAPLGRLRGVRLRSHVRAELKETAAALRDAAPRTAVGASRLIQQVARMCGAPPAGSGPYVERRLTREGAEWAARKLASLPAARRAELTGISRARSVSSATGAIVIHTAMRSFAIRELLVCPWGIREGLLLRYIEGNSLVGLGRSADEGGDAAERLGLPRVTAERTA